MEERNYAGFAIRLIAFIVDVIILWLISSLLGLPAEVSNTFLSFLNWGIYQSLTGHSIGKQIIGLRVIKENGDSLTLGTGILRYFAEILSAIILFIGYFMVAWSPTKQGLHDRVARTYVVRK